MNSSNADCPNYIDKYIASKNHPHPKMWWCEVFYCV